MTKSTSEDIRAVLERIKNTKPREVPYYNEAGQCIAPIDTRPDGAYWPQPNPHDLPDVNYLENDHYE